METNDRIVQMEDSDDGDPVSNSQLYSFTNLNFVILLDCGLL